MKQGKTLIDLATEIQRQVETKRDFVADTRQLEMVMNGSMKLRIKSQDDEPVRTGSITDHCHNQIGARVGIPAKYYRRMQDEAPELLAHNVNTWFAQKPERRMVRTLDGRARAFLSDRYARIDNHEVLEATLPILQEVGQPLGLRIMSCDVTERKLYIKAVTERVEADVKVGDTVQQGLVISNSEIGQGALVVQPMTYRLICLNGMVTGSGLKKHHVGRRIDEDLEGLLSDNTKRLEDAATLGKVRDVLTAALDGTFFNENVKRLQRSTEQKIEGNPVKAVEVLGDTLGLTEGETGGVLRHLIEGGDLSQFGVVQAVTAFARDDSGEMSYDRATELEIAGGKVLDLTRSEWTRIAEAA